jgi:hypothetical protein
MMAGMKDSTRELIRLLREYREHAPFPTAPEWRKGLTQAYTLNRRNMGSAAWRERILKAFPRLIAGLPSDD